MKYRLTKSAYDDTVAYMTGLIARQAPVEETPLEQQIADHIENRFGCHRSMVHTLVTLLARKGGWVLPKGVARDDEGVYPDVGFVGVIVNTDMGINYLKGTPVVITHADLGVGTVEDCKGFHIGNHLRLINMRPMKTIEEVTEFLDKVQTEGIETRGDDYYLKTRPEVYEPFETTDLE